MKSNLVFLVLSLLYLSCNSPANRSAAIKKDTLTNKPSSANDSEYMDWGKVKINGTIPMISSFKDVVKQLGEPDKIDTLADGVNGSYFNKKFQYCYFKALTFEKYNDTLVFSSIDFSKPTYSYLTDGRTRFDASFKNLDFKKLFPYSFDNNQLTGTSMDIYEYINLATAPKKTNDEWGFTFHTNTGKVWSIDYDDPYTDNK